MSMYDENHYNIVISLQLIKINEKKRKKLLAYRVSCDFNFPYALIFLIHFFKNVFNFKKKLFKKFF